MGDDLEVLPHKPAVARGHPNGCGTSLQDLEHNLMLDGKANVPYIEGKIRLYYLSKQDCELQSS